MSESSNQSHDLRLINTPLQNLKNILSDVDAIVETDPDSFKEFNEKSVQHVTKAAVRKLIEEFSVDPRQFFSSQILSNALNEIRPTIKKDTDKVFRNFSENRHVAELDRLLKKL